MKLLLGATAALLLGALVMSLKGMNNGVNNASPDELVRLKDQVAEIIKEQDKLQLLQKQDKLQLDKLQLDLQLQQFKAATPPQAAPPTPATNAADIETMKAQLAQIEADKEKAKAKRDAKVEQDEEGLIARGKIEKTDDELRRARMIGEALLIGKVKEYVEDAQTGGFVTFDILMPEQVQAPPSPSAARPASSANSRCPKSPPKAASPTPFPASAPSSQKSVTNSSWNRSGEVKAETLRS